MSGSSVVWYNKVLKRIHGAQGCRGPVGGKAIQLNTGVPGWATIVCEGAMLTMSWPAPRAQHLS